MNPHSGHLIDAAQLRDLARDPEYIPVPPHLEDDARRLLAGEAEAKVRLRGDGPLSAWRRAEKRRNERARQKAAKLARKRNRP
jgi:hypothetical protein